MFFKYKTHVTRFFRVYMLRQNLHEHVFIMSHVSYIKKTCHILLWCAYVCPQHTYPIKTHVACVFRVHINTFGREFALFPYPSTPLAPRSPHLISYPLPPHYSTPRLFHLTTHQLPPPHPPPITLLTTRCLSWTSFRSTTFPVIVLDHGAKHGERYLTF